MASNQKPRLRQGLEMIYAAMRYQLTREEYREYRLYFRDKTLEDISRYLSRWTFEKCYLPRMNPTRLAPMLMDKWLFYLYYGGKGLPLPKVYGVYGPDREGPGQIIDATGLEWLLMDHKPKSLVIRPLQGRGSDLDIKQVNYNPQPLLVTKTGQEMTVPELEYLLQGGEWLLQENLRQHSFLTELNPHGLNTIRVITFVNVDDSVDIHFAVLRLGLKETSLASRDTEIIVAVDANTGKLGKGIYRNSHEGQATSIHPNTLAVFNGAVLPQWGEVTALAKAAALAMPQMRAVGWDIVLTPRGPVLLDGHRDWDIGMMQGSGGYLQPEVLAKLNLCGLEFEPCLKLEFFKDMIRQRA